MKDLSVWSLKYGESVLPEHLIFKGGDSGVSLPIVFAMYFIQTESRNILVDVGCETMPGFVMKQHYSPAFVLREVGISADDITDIIITHAHHDHVAALPHFRNAKVYVHADEHDRIKRYLADDTQVCTFQDSFKVENFIEIVKVGGHTCGSCVVEVDCGDVTLVIAGDECYYNACVSQKRPTGSSYNDARSLEFVEKYAGNKYRVLTMHDPAVKTEKIR